MAGVADKIFDLVKDTVEQQGVSLWDVKYIKEGASYYLRIFIDKPEGINIDDCVNVSHAVDPVIDEADPIKDSYYLEVCSPGLERELTREEHYKAMIGSEISIKLFKAVDGKKQFSGILKDFDTQAYIETESGMLKFNKADIAKATAEFKQ